MIPTPHRLLTLAFIITVIAACVTPAPPTSQPPPSPRVTPTRPAIVPSLNPTASALPTNNPTASPPNNRTAILAETINQVQTRNTAADVWVTAIINQTLTVGGEVQTLADSQARIDLSEGALIRIGPNTLFTVTELSGSNYDPITRLTLAAGEVWVILNSALNGGSFDVETPVGTASVRGSYLSVNYDPQTDSLIISCLEGHCNLRNKLGAIDLIAGQESAILKRGQRPNPAQAMSPEQLERWQQFVREAKPLIGPMRQQLDSLRATQAVLNVTPQLNILRTLAATALPNFATPNLPLLGATLSTPPLPGGGGIRP